MIQIENKISGEIIQTDTSNYKRGINLAKFYHCGTVSTRVSAKTIILSVGSTGLFEDEDIKVSLIPGIWKSQRSVQLPKVDLTKKTDKPISVQTYCNTHSGLLFKTEVRTPGVLHKVIGKSVKVENLEMNHLLIDGVYYGIIGYYGTLAHVVEVVQ